MKTTSLHFTMLPGSLALAVACLLLLPHSLMAKDHDDDDHGRSKNSKHHKAPHHSDHDDHDRDRYLSHPRSGFTLSLGTGYAGRGYYYGPPHSSYYYQRPEVRYYATRESYHSHSGTTEVQRALARRGYYHGSIDGDIGPQSRRAIALYQQDHRLRATGSINQSLLDSLGL
jgi:hypothetical protein